MCNNLVHALGSHNLSNPCFVFVVFTIAHPLIDIFNEDHVFIIVIVINVALAG